VSALCCFGFPDSEISHHFYEDYIVVQDKVAQVVDYLNEVKTRCTYNAAAKALGITPPALKKFLGDRKPENSWLVSTGTGEPAGYADEEKHPELHRTKRIITSAEVIERNLGF
jgi:hypothetical protein